MYGSEIILQVETNEQREAKSSPNHFPIPSPPSPILRKSLAKTSVSLASRVLPCVRVLHVNRLSTAVCTSANVLGFARVGLCVRVVAAFLPVYRKERTGSLIFPSCCHSSDPVGRVGCYVVGILSGEVGWTVVYCPVFVLGWVSSTNCGFHFFSHWSICLENKFIH
jgi:hypothetical protein